MKYFIPCNLSADAIRQLFMDALVVPSSKNRISCSLFKKENGFPEDSRPVVFDKDYLTEMHETLEIMLGQLKDVHDKKEFTSPKTINIKYDNTIWMKSKQSLIEVLHLATAAEIIGPLQSDYSAKFTKQLIPILSTSDPKYREWFLENEKTLTEYLCEPIADD